MKRREKSFYYLKIYRYNEGYINIEFIGTFHHFVFESVQDLIIAVSRK